MASGTILNYPKEKYNLQKLRSGILTEAQMRKEYSYLRTIANKRLKRMEKSEFSDSEIFLKNRYKFVSLKSITDADELAFRLYELVNFVESRSSTITGQKYQRKEIINNLHAKGMIFINEKNYKQFMDFMETVRSLYKSRNHPDSERAYEAFVIAEAKKLNPLDVFESFEEYKDDVEKLEEYSRKTNPKKVNSEDFKKMLNSKNNSSRRGRKK